MTPDAFERAVRAGDIAQMEDLLHRFEVRPGDVYWVEVGTPHAIGSGVFMVEVQEPADLTIYCEPGGEKIDAMNAHLGLSWRDAAQAFSAVGRSRDEALDRWRGSPPSCGARRRWTARGAPRWTCSKGVLSSLSPARRGTRTCECPCVQPRHRNARGGDAFGTDVFARRPPGRHAAASCRTWRRGGGVRARGGFTPTRNDHVPSSGD